VAPRQTPLPYHSPNHPTISAASRSGASSEADARDRPDDRKHMLEPCPNSGGWRIQHAPTDENGFPLDKNGKSW